MFGTQARILMTEWKALAKLIIAHSAIVKEKPIANIEDLENFDIENLENLTFSTTNDLPDVLTQKQVQTALQGPFGALLKDKMAAYAKIARLRLEIHLAKEELFKNKRAVKPESEQISAKKLDKLSVEQLDLIQHNLDMLTEQHDQEWREFIHHWSEQLLNFLNESRTGLTEREIDEFYHEETSTALLPRFIELGLKLPQKEYPQMSCVDYLHLKAILMIQSALSRQHLPHDDSEIQLKLKNFKSDFSDMEKQEQQARADQQQLTDAILSPLE
jgi:hypothetical protein